MNEKKCYICGRTEGELDEINIPLNKSHADLYVCGGCQDIILYTITADTPYVRGTEELVNEEINQRLEEISIKIK